LTTILRGLSSLPVMFAGHAAVQRPALRARVAVEQVLPRQVLDVAHAELLGGLVLEVHVPHHPHLPRPARVREVGVGERDDDVQVLRVRQVVEEPEHAERVSPPAEGVDAVCRPLGEPADEPRQPARDEAPLVGRRVGPLQQLLHRVRDEQREHEEGDGAQDDHRLPRLDAVALQPARLRHEPAPDQHAHRGQHEQPERLLREGERRVEQRREEARVAEAAPHALDEHLERAGAEHEEAPEDEGVHRAGDGIAQDLGLRDADGEEVPEPAPGVVEAVLGPAERRHEVEQALRVVREEPGRQHQDDEKHGVAERHGAPPLRTLCMTERCSGSVAR
jgi:hypothetical protein